MGWTDEVTREVKRLRADGFSWTHIAQTIKRNYPDLAETESQVLRKARHIAREMKPTVKVPVQDVLIAALAKGADLTALAQKMGTSPRVAEAMIEDAREQGYNVQPSNKGYAISKILPPTENWQVKPWGGEKIIRFGLMGDTQLGCIDTQITLLHHLYDYYEREGITDVYHTGDMTDGERMRPGQEYELYVHGADAQVEHVVKVYPKRKGMNTTFIIGNHDYSFIKTIGLDIGRQIASRRDDMHYAGYMSAIIQLSPGCTLELRHPQDGTAYALSYKMQKIIEAMSGGEKPSILAVGHYHKAEYLVYRNIHALQTGTLCAQTAFMRGKGIAAYMGGWIIELKLRDDGVISEFNPRFIPFYAAIKEDYKKWL